jgi:hypothetical protein
LTRGTYQTVAERKKRAKELRSKQKGLKKNNKESKQYDWPKKLCEVPSSQGIHASCEVELAQGKQKVDPAVSVYVPMGQVGQEFWPCKFW